MRCIENGWEIFVIKAGWRKCRENDNKTFPLPKSDIFDVMGITRMTRMTDSKKTSQHETSFTGKNRI